MKISCCFGISDSICEIEDLFTLWRLTFKLDAVVESPFVVMPVLDDRSGISVLLCRSPVGTCIKV